MLFVTLPLLSLLGCPVSLTIGGSINEPNGENNFDVRDEDPWEDGRDEDSDENESASSAEYLHDPSRIAFTGESLMVVASEPFVGENTEQSAFLLYEYENDGDGWTKNETVFVDAYDKLPASWLEDLLPTNELAYWAPALASSTEMYYSVYDLAMPGRACIGHAKAVGVGKNAVWVDTGAPVVCTSGPESENEPVAIDPALFDDAEGNKWMVWGSHGAGIYVSLLDVETGLLANDGDATFSTDSDAFHFVAQNEEGGANGGIEAPYILHYGSYYYLFVNWGACCGGTDSTYNIRVGRSTSPNGPFLDKSGVDMTEGGGSLFLESTGRFTGPGHAGTFSYGEEQVAFSYHFYDAEHADIPTPDNNWASMAINELTFVNGWPVLGEELAPQTILDALQ